MRAGESSRLHRIRDSGMPSWTAHGLTTDAPHFFHPEKCASDSPMLFWNRIVTHLPKFFLIHKEKGRAEKQKNQATQEKLTCFHFIWLTTLENDQEYLYGCLNVYLQEN